MTTREDRQGLGGWSAVSRLLYPLGLVAEALQRLLNPHFSRFHLKEALLIQNQGGPT